MNKPRVFIYGGPTRSFVDSTVNMLEDHGGYTRAFDETQADILLLTGGDDINPKLYGETPISGVSWGRRDFYDIGMIQKAYTKGLFMVGVCRGAQLLNCVPNGGKLWQDVDGHLSGLHQVKDCQSEQYFLVNTSHHQQMRPSDKGEILCVGHQTTKRTGALEVKSGPFLSSGGVVKEKDKDVEVVWYPETKSLCFQPHPEWGHEPTTIYFFELLQRYYAKSKAA